MANSSPADFYDGLAEFYDLNYANWRESIERQAAALDSILRERDIHPPARILDAACGIGTQALGLARLGYRVTGSDISDIAVSRAREEASQRGLTIDFSVADMRELDRQQRHAFDVVMACDNALPHLLSDEDILRAFRAFHALVAPGGVCIVSVRDYDAEDRTPLQVRPPVVHDSGDVRRIVFQAWSFAGEVYDISLYVVEDDGGPEPRTHVFRSRYYAVSIEVLLQLMAKAGFTNLERIDGVFFQPVLVGRRAPEP